MTRHPVPRATDDGERAALLVLFRNEEGWVVGLGWVGEDVGRVEGEGGVGLHWLLFWGEGKNFG